MYYSPASISLLCLNHLCFTLLKLSLMLAELRFYYFLNSMPVPPRVTDHSSGYGSHHTGNDYEYSRRAFGATLDSINRSRSRRPDRSSPVPYHSY